MLIEVSVLALAAVATLVSFCVWRTSLARRARRHQLQSVFARFIAANQVEAASHPLIDLFLEDTADVDLLFPDSELPRLRLELHAQASELRRLEDSLDAGELDIESRSGIVEACLEKRTWFNKLAHALDGMFGADKDSTSEAEGKAAPGQQGLSSV